jgi:hypothetical protein
MREALQEARDYRDPKQTEVSEGNLSYDEWLKQVKGIKKGAHGINSDEHAKYSKEWKSYASASESNLEEIVGGHGDMTITKDGGVMIIKTKDWQTYKAKGWVKKTNESLDLTATGDTTTSNASQEVEGEELNEGRVMIAVDKKTKKKWQFSGGMTVKHGGKTYDTEGVSMQQVLELSSRQGDIKLGKKDVEAGFASGTFSVVNDGSVYQPWKNDFEPEGEELNEFWPFGKKDKLPKGYNPKPAVKAYDLFHKAYDELKKSGVIDRDRQGELQELYYHLVVNHLGSREANRLKIKTINGPDRRYGDGQIFQDATR